MCGIAGIACFGDIPGPRYEQLKGMCDTLIHRGPDDEGIDIRDGVGMGMRRLAIIDLSGGKQPIANEDDTIRVVFNGEIYNFRELRSDLKSKGHRFSTRSDTEVIVHAYEEFGPGFPKRLNGMFAFSLHDGKNRKLILARDHVGIKPLYYAFDGNRLVWGSEIKAILASGLVERELNLDALGEFMAWEYVPGTRTLFKGISQVGPGEMVEVALDAPEFHPVEYWDVPLHGSWNFRRKEEWVEEVDGKIKACTGRQLVSDVPLGAFLSGGVDSSMIVASMGEAKAYSIGFDDPTYNELRWAKKVAGHLQVAHHTEIIRPEVESLFHNLVHFMDDPIGDFSIFPTYLVSKMARQYVTVALSGDGGDELFGGYETYLADQKARQYLRLPALLRGHVIEPMVQSLRPRPAKKGLVNKAKRFLEGMDQRAELGHARWRIFGTGETRRELFTADALKSLVTPPESHILDLFRRAGERDPLNRSLYVDLKSYLCDDILTKVDRMSMAVSLETRVPFLDPEMVELAFAIPGELKVSGGKTKILLKNVAERHIPRDCIYRPKEGFSIPIKNWLCKELRQWMGEVLDPKTISGDGLFRAGTVSRLMKEHLSGQANHSHVLWSLIVFQSWKRHWMKG
jgi:asparagine synthase (glutamine-hydrolysing)